MLVDVLNDPVSVNKTKSHKEHSSFVTWVNNSQSRLMPGAARFYLISAVNEKLKSLHLKERVINNGNLNK